MNNRAQEMLIELINGFGCEVILRPHPDPSSDAFEIIISLRGRKLGTVYSRLAVLNSSMPEEEYACKIIERMAASLILFPYKRMTNKHFQQSEKETAENGTSLSQ